jgi:Asp-tRNA(Asn)/Glu-tRNA(Gln) amidotransferase A subunit family amidase
MVGIDSIGGVRVPGGYCGVLAFRPSHAVISNSGVIPVAPSLDTIGTSQNVILITTQNMDLDL